MELFILLKDKPNINIKFVKNDEKNGRYTLKNGNIVTIHKEVNNSYLLNYHYENVKNPIDDLKQAGFVVGKHLIL